MTRSPRVHFRGHESLPLCSLSINLEFLPQHLTFWHPSLPAAGAGCVLTVTVGANNSILNASTRP